MSPSFSSLSAAACRNALLLSLPLLLVACEAPQFSDRIFGVITPYRIEIVQGNVITKEQAAYIKPGLTRAQVRDVLGSPLLADPFHADRWDYVFTIKRQGTPPQSRRVIVLFKDDVLASVDTGGELPAENDFVASIDTFHARRDPPPLALTDAQVQALKPPPRIAEPAPDASAPARTYPPLEPRS